MVEIDAADLLPADRLRDAALAGEITQLHRGDAHAAEGDTFEIDGNEFRVTDVTERRLGELTDADARAAIVRSRVPQNSDRTDARDGVGRRAHRRPPPLRTALSRHAPRRGHHLSTSVGWILADG